MNYGCSYFIKKFEAIPESMWRVGEFGEGERHCALGHCGMRNVNYYNDGKVNEESSALAGLLKTLDVGLYHSDLSIVYKVNDHGVINMELKYNLPTPKQRILAALYDIKKMQEPKEKVIVKYVAVDAAIKELELISN